MSDLRLHQVRFTRASRRHVDAGLLGFVTFQLGEVVLDGVALRRTRDGRIALSFPRRHVPGGRDYSFIRPVDQQARDRITRAVLAAIDPTLIATTGVDQ